MKPLLCAAFFWASGSALATETAISVPPPPPPSGTGTCISVSTVADTYIWAAAPNLNFGSESGLYTGIRWTGETQTLIAFSVAGIVPAGAILTSASFNVFSMNAVEGEEVRAHRILTSWDENTVTWNNFGGYDPAVAGSMLAANWSWLSLDLTDLVAAWIGGTDNDGILLEQDSVGKTTFASTEHSIELKHPYLEVCWEEPPPPAGCIGDTVWLDSNGNGTYEPASGELPVAGVTLDLYAGTQWLDSMVTDGAGQYLFCELPAGTYGVAVAAASFAAGGPLAGLAQTYDYDGLLDNATQYVLAAGEEFLAADFGYLPLSNPGVGTPGYWKNHPEAWPVESLVVGGVSLSTVRLIAYLGTPKKSDKTYIMAQALIAAMLNVAAGNEWSCIEDDIAAAQQWLTANPIGTGGNSAWTTGQMIQQHLDDYNNGFLCALPRE